MQAFSSDACDRTCMRQHTRKYIYINIVFGVIYRHFKNVDTT